MSVFLRYFSISKALRSPMLVLPSNMVLCSVSSERICKHKTFYTILYQVKRHNFCLCIRDTRVSVHEIVLNVLLNKKVLMKSLTCSLEGGSTVLLSAASTGCFLALLLLDSSMIMAANCDGSVLMEASAIAEAMVLILSIRLLLLMSGLTVVWLFKL